MNADLKRVREASGGTGAEDGMSPSKKRALGSFTSVSSQSQGQDDDDQEDWMKELEVGASSINGCIKVLSLQISSRSSEKKLSIGRCSSTGAYTGKNPSGPMSLRPRNGF